MKLGKLFGMRGVRQWVVTMLVGAVFVAPLHSAVGQWDFGTPKRILPDTLLQTLNAEPTLSILKPFNYPGNGKTWAFKLHIDTKGILCLEGVNPFKDSFCFTPGRACVSSSSCPSASSSSGDGSIVETIWRYSPGVPMSELGATHATLSLSYADNFANNEAAALQVARDSQIFVEQTILANYRAANKSFPLVLNRWGSADTIPLGLAGEIVEKIFGSGAKEAIEKVLGKATKEELEKAAKEAAEKLVGSAGSAAEKAAVEKALKEAGLACSRQGTRRWE
jgi:hypothetical protein